MPHYGYSNFCRKGWTERAYLVDVVFRKLEILFLLALPLTIYWKVHSLSIKSLRVNFCKPPYTGSFHIQMNNYQQWCVTVPAITELGCNSVLFGLLFSIHCLSNKTEMPSEWIFKRLESARPQQLFINLVWLLSWVQTTSCKCCEPGWMIFFPAVVSCSNSSL